MKKYDPLKELKKEQVSIWRRGLAFIIDILIIQFIVNLNFNKLLAADLSNDKSLIELFNYSLENYSSLEPKLLTISIITAILALIYFILFEWKLKQTIGKMLFKIKITSENKRLEFYQVLIRNLPKAALFVNYTIWIFFIDLIYHSFTRRRLFDKLAKTNIEKIN